MLEHPIHLMFFCYFSYFVYSVHFNLSYRELHHRTVHCRLPSHSRTGPVHRIEGETSDCWYYSYCLLLLLFLYRVVIVDVVFSKCTWQLINTNGVFFIVASLNGMRLTRLFPIEWANWRWLEMHSPFSGHSIQFRRHKLWRHFAMGYDRVVPTTYLPRCVCICESVGLLLNAR